jgi:hypothetical protein
MTTERRATVTIMPDDDRYRWVLTTTDVAGDVTGSVADTRDEAEQQGLAAAVGRGWARDFIQVLG